MHVPSAHRHVPSPAVMTQDPLDRGRPQLHSAQIFIPCIFGLAKLFVLIPQEGAESVWQRRRTGEHYFPAIHRLTSSSITRLQLLCRASAGTHAKQSRLAGGMQEQHTLLDLVIPQELITRNESYVSIEECSSPGLVSRIS